jgi:hypothetical protein
MRIFRLKHFATAAGFCLLLAGCAAPSLTPEPGTPASRGNAPYRWLGRTGGGLRAILGTPAFARRDGTASLWRYDAKDCHAFFFLYGDAKQSANEQMVRHVETLPKAADGGPDRKCLSALRLSAKPSS